MMLLILQLFEKVEKVKKGIFSSIDDTWFINKRLAYPPMMWVKNDPFKKYLNLAILVFVAKFGKYLDRAIKKNSFWIPLKYLKQDIF